MKRIEREFSDEKQLLMEIKHELRHFDRRLNRRIKAIDARENVMTSQLRGELQRRAATIKGLLAEYERWF